MWRLEIRHTTSYEYARDVLASYNEVRVTPLSTFGQVTLDARLEVDPGVPVRRYWDYWGTLVHAFDVHLPHRQLRVTGHSLVETPESHALVEDEAGWDDLASAEVVDDLFEYVARTTYVPLAEVDSDGGELAGVVAEVRASSPTPVDAVAAACDWVRSRLEYQPGATDVSTSAVEALARGRGVCQDFVHLALVLLRSMGIPARYVSGYFHPSPQSPIGTPVVAESHAWLEAWTGSWNPVDPTNLVEVGHRHVVVARGRDYRDVPPLKGIYRGAPPSLPDVLVEITRRS